ncbi:hypothetical protein [Thermococcus pacificus]|uniref:hypothetical protein n=1 Tax=Thermococcus pacificus TaxID=71998 RepID=UPI0018DF6C5A|nr:hypothetical protein [Thermococcus pacificus]
MEHRVVLYWLLVSLAFTLTQPGAITFANWDAPYGFYKDLSTWLSCAGAFLILITAYGIIEWRRERLRPIHPLGAGILSTFTILLDYWAEGFIRGEMGYGSSNILVFIIGGFIGLLLALMLLFPMIIYIFVEGLDGFYYSYDMPLIVAWLVSLAVSATLLVIYVKIRRGRNSRNREAKPLEHHPDGQKGQNNGESLAE